MFNPNRARMALRERRAGMEPEDRLVIFTIEDLLNDEQLDFAIDVARGDESSRSFETVVLEFRSN
jgi:hypothetical protein